MDLSTGKILEPIRLVVWDLDETFWSGTLSEGGINALIEEHHSLVRLLARRGIMSSICSMNELESVRTTLEAIGLWEYFIFPSIDWSPKGARVAAMIDAVGLRPSSVVFLDDNPRYRAEVAAAAPGIVVADETFSSKIECHPMFTGKDDRDLTRLKQYKTLEQKKIDEHRFDGAGIDFLRNCNIRIRIEYDVEPHLDRVVELINRTNQLNFTKVRLPDDPAEAKSEVLTQIRFFGHQAGLIEAEDRYGKYGYVGFFLKALDDRMTPGQLKHFCFSCRTIGMGIEQWVYNFLGRPHLHHAGAEWLNVQGSRTPDWIGTNGHGYRQIPKVGENPEVRLRGSCVISALSHYFSLSGSVTCVENSFPIGPFAIRNDVSTSLFNMLCGDSLDIADISMPGLRVEGAESRFLLDTRGPTLLILNLWADLYVPRYRHISGRYFVHAFISGFMEPGGRHAAGDIASWSDSELRDRAFELGLDSNQLDRLFDVVKELRNNYVFVDLMGENEIKFNLRAISVNIPDKAHLALILPSYAVNDRDKFSRNADYIRWCKEELSGCSNIHLFEIDNAIADPSQRCLGFDDHFDRIVYYRLAEDIKRNLMPLMNSLPPAIEKTQLYGAQGGRD